MRDRYRHQPWILSKRPVRKPNKNLKYKYGKIDGWSSKRGKVHLKANRSRYACGQFIDKRDTISAEVPKDKIRENLFCKNCFPDLIVYPDQSLEEELFSI